MEEALASLDLLVAVDPYLTETARHADVVLPPRVAFERDELEVVFGSVSVRNMARYSPRVVDPGPDTKEDAQILAGLVERLSARIGSPQRRARGVAMAQVVLRGQMDRLMDLGVRSGPYGRFGFGLSLGRIRAATHGLDLGELVPSLPGRLFTPGRRIPLDHPVLMGDLVRVRERLDEAVPSPGDELLLIGRRHLRSNNSWLANSPRLVRGRDRCTLLIHPADASARGIAHGQRALLRGPSGSIELPAEVSDEIAPGVVAVPHGWGHDRAGVGWRVAAAHPGANVNDVTGSVPMDPLSGNAVLQAVPVRVEPVAPAAG
jgi:anaerobic selenocysteine-containing dehydrogenase